MERLQADTKSRVFAPGRAGLLLLMALVALSGCGTMANLEGRQRPFLSHVGVETPQPFGGVRRDLGWLSSVKAPANLIFVADLPASLVGDLLTLPKTLATKRTGSSNQASESDPEPFPLESQRPNPSSR